MYWDLSKMSKLFAYDNNSKLLAEGNFGLELESVADVLLAVRLVLQEQSII